MIAQYNRKSLFWGIPGAWLHLCGAMTLVAGSGGGEDGIVSDSQMSVAGFFMFVGTVLFVVAFSYYARSKGRNGFWGLFGLIGLIGIVVLAFLKDITQDGIEATAQEQLPGAPDGTAAATMYPETKTSGLAVASLVLGIVALVTLNLTAVPGLILGIVALDKIKKNPEALKGRGLAIAGIVVSSVFCAVLLLNWLSRSTR